MDKNAFLSHFISHHLLLCILYSSLIKKALSPIHHTPYGLYTLHVLFSLPGIPLPLQGLGLRRHGTNNTPSRKTCLPSLRQIYWLFSPCAPLCKTFPLELLYQLQIPVLISFFSPQIVTLRIPICHPTQISACSTMYSSPK